MNYDLWDEFKSEKKKKKTERDNLDLDLYFIEDDADIHFKIWEVSADLL